MPLQMEWHTVHRIMHIHYWGNITDADLNDFLIQAPAFYEPAIAPMYFLGDVGQIQAIHANLLNNRDLAHYLLHPKIAYVITYGHTAKILHFFSSVITQATGLKYKHVESLSEALDYIYKLEPALKD